MAKLSGEGVLLQLKNTGYLKNLIGKRKSRPKAVVSMGFLF